MLRRSTRKATVIKSKQSEDLSAAEKSHKQRDQAKKSINEEFKRLSSCLGIIEDSEDSVEIIDLVSRVPDQGEALSANNLSEEEEVFEDFRQNQSVNLPSPTVDRRGVVVFGNWDRLVSIGVNRVNCGCPSATTPERQPLLSVTSPHLPQVLENLPANMAMADAEYEAKKRRQDLL